MKKLILSITGGLCFLSVWGQNLVPNGSFESFTSCPNTTSQLSYTGNWVFCGASTDYYNFCSPPGNMSVPWNIYGYQDAFEGGAYIGMIAYELYEDTAAIYFREPAGTFLTTPLVPGTKYYVSFKAVMTLNDFSSCCATNKLGALFSATAFTDCYGSHPAPINNFAHIYTESVISDTLNWTMVSGSFTADSAYTFVAIGNFFDSTQLTVVDYQNNFPFTSVAYYYIDDIRVSTDSSFVLGITPSVIIHDLFVSPNPADDFVQLKASKPIESIAIYSVTGALKYRLEKPGAQVDISDLEPGIYLLSVKIDGVIVTKKLVKQ